jgi:hypothetical protein
MNSIGKWFLSRNRLTCPSSVQKTERKRKHKENKVSFSKSTRCINKYYRIHEKLVQQNFVGVN